MEASLINHAEPTINTKPSALDAYLARTAAIHTKLVQLQQLADETGRMTYDQ